jgi:hypothetical protein
MPTSGLHSAVEFIAGCFRLYSLKYSQGYKNASRPLTLMAGEQRRPPAPSSIGRLALKIVSRGLCDAQVGFSGSEAYSKHWGKYFRKDLACDFMQGGLGTINILRASRPCQFKKSRTWLGSNKPQPVADKANPDFVSLGLERCWWNCNGNTLLYWLERWCHYGRDRSRASNKTN